MTKHTVHIIMGHSGLSTYEFGVDDICLHLSHQYNCMLRHQFISFAVLVYLVFRIIFGMWLDPKYLIVACLICWLPTRGWPNTQFISPLNGLPVWHLLLSFLPGVFIFLRFISYPRGIGIDYFMVYSISMCCNEIVCMWSLQFANFLWPWLTDWQKDGKFL